MLRKGGKFYFFGTHRDEEDRIQRPQGLFLEVSSMSMEGRYRVDSFSYVDDGGDLVRDADLSADAVGKNFNCHYGCGIFELTKA
ncbi:MAG TPA: hypothetical protein P5308_02880 [Syntrophales bacterium]|nr:hypothetical protein [Syntrophales bacterium]